MGRSGADHVCANDSNNMTDYNTLNTPCTCAWDNYEDPMGNLPGRSFASNTDTSNISPSPSLGPI